MIDLDVPSRPALPDCTAGVAAGATARALAELGQAGVELTGVPVVHV
ncbi:hypothetical protein ACIQOV_05440 [Kitasatospora sp. NPDC091257]